MTLFPLEMKTLASTPVSAGGSAVCLVLSSSLLLFSWFGYIAGDELDVFISTDSFPRKSETSRSILHTTSTLNKSSSDEDSDARFIGAMLPGDKSKPENTANSTKWSPKMDSGCDLYQGEWVYDSRGPLYNNGSCPVLTQTQNCQGNGRPDRDYENWRWKPTHCDLPRFDARSFLDLMKGKTLAFVGDSIARNQMESLLCILWQVEVPKNLGNKGMQRYNFASTSTTIIRIWSAYLVYKTTEKSDFAPPEIDKIHLDTPDEAFMQFIPEFDVTVLSSGHWFTKKSSYILNNEIVGGQPSPKKSTISNAEAFAISVETALSAMVTDPNYSGLTVVRTFSPDHYEGGKWNTGGSCTGKVDPAKNVVENKWTTKMHNQQIRGFRRALKKMRNGSRLKLMDITEAFGYRRDGHPGPYRSTDPNKKTKRGLDGKPPPQDCLHWCMPGPVDTWNEILFEVVRRDLDGTRERDVSSS